MCVLFSSWNGSSSSSKSMPLQTAQPKTLMPVRLTYITVRPTFNVFIFSTVASQSSSSMGFSASVRRTTFLVHVFFFSRCLSCVSTPTMRASTAMHGVQNKDHQM